MHKLTKNTHNISNIYLVVCVLNTGVSQKFSGSHIDRLVYHPPLEKRLDND